MAPLPAGRLIPQRPFAVTGLDYAGPLPVLFSKGRGAKTTKGYVAIFICFVIRAIHIEIVSDLTEGFAVPCTPITQQHSREHRPNLS